MSKREVSLLTLADTIDRHENDIDESWPWNVALLDQGLGGAIPGALVIVGADSGVGKSFFCLHAATASRFPSLLISLEESAGEIGKRVSSLKGSEDLSRVHVWAPTLYDFADILKAIRQAHKEHDVRAIYIDYLQLVDYDGKRRHSNRTEEIKCLLLDLRDLAKELQIVVIVAAQLKEVPNGVQRVEPEMSDIADSVSVKRLAWGVVLLFEMAGMICAKVKKSKRCRAGTRDWFDRGPNGLFVRVPSREAKQRLDAAASEGSDDDNF